MAVMPIRIENELIIPFGWWGCESHRMMGSADSSGTLIESCGPRIYINRVRRVPVTLDRFSDAFPSQQSDFSDPCGPPGPSTEDPSDTADMMCDLLRNHCDLQDSYEHLFLSLYFDRLKTILDSETGSGRNPVAVRNLLRRHLMPLPQAHLYYLTDFTPPDSGELTEECVRVDFAFWTGQRFTAVLLDRPGSKVRVREEELMRLWGLEILHLSTDNLESGRAGSLFSRLCVVPNQPARA
jgi:hypothetical protein